jgi:hypothetical protein
MRGSRVECSAYASLRVQYLGGYPRCPSRLVGCFQGALDGLDRKIVEV